LSRKIVVVYGNCQATFIVFLLNQSPSFLERFELVMVNIHTPPGAQVPELPEGVENAALYWEQYDERAAIPIREETRKQIPEGCPTLVYPPLAGMAFWPFAWADSRSAPEPQYPWGRYPWGDRIGLEIARLNLPESEIFDRYMELSMQKMPDIVELARRDHFLAAKRDAACDVQIQDFLLPNYLTDYLFWTWGHTSSVLMFELIRRLFEKSEHVLGPITPEIESELQAAVTRYPAIGAEQLPIHPEVIRRLGLTFCTPDTRYRWFDQEWTFEEYITRYITLDTSW
jgi:hypothetical protein